MSTPSEEEIEEVLRWAQSREEYADTPFANMVPRVIRHIIAERDDLREQSAYFAELAKRDRDDLQRRADRTEAALREVLAQLKYAQKHHAMLSTGVAINIIEAAIAEVLP